MPLHCINHLVCKKYAWGESLWLTSHAFTDVVMFTVWCSQKILEYYFALESRTVGCWQSEWGSQSGSGWLALIWLQCSLTSQVTKLWLWPRPQPFQPKWALESGLSERQDFPLSLSPSLPQPQHHRLQAFIVCNVGTIGEMIAWETSGDVLCLWVGLGWAWFYTAHTTCMELNFLPSFILLIYMILKGSYH